MLIVYRLLLIEILYWDDSISNIKVFFIIAVFGNKHTMKLSSIYTWTICFKE